MSLPPLRSYRSAEEDGRTLAPQPAHNNTTIHNNSNRKPTAETVTSMSSRGTKGSRQTSAGEPKRTPNPLHPDQHSSTTSSTPVEDGELGRLKGLLRDQSKRLTERVDPEVDPSLYASVVEGAARMSETNSPQRVGFGEGDEDAEQVAVVDLPHTTSSQPTLGGAKYYTNPELSRNPMAVLDGQRSVAQAVSPGRGTARTLVDADPEVRRLADEVAKREGRMEDRAAELRRQWDNPVASTGRIEPASPAVFSAETEDEIREKAAAAEDFAENHVKRQKLQLKQQRLLQQQQGSSIPTQRQGSTSSSNDSSERPDTRQGDASPYTPDPRATNETVATGSPLASSSISKLSYAAQAVMNMLGHRHDVVLPSPTETSVVRTGDVLSSDHILKLDLQDALHDRHGPTGMIAGAPFFRVVPKLNIAGVAQANLSSIKAIINELRRAHIDGPVIWVNLREEPLVYLNNVAHIVRERNDPLKPVIIPNVTGRVIESIESKLKQEVLQEAMENGGNISVHVEGTDGIMEDQWVSADTQSVQTLAEAFHTIARGLGTTLEVQYYRRPITQNIGPQPGDFDFVLEACLEEPKAVIVFNCQTGRGRTSSMMQIANIVRFYQLCVKDVSADVRLLRGSSTGPTFRTIQKLVSLFPDGKLHERRLVVLMDMADKVYSISQHINNAFENMDGSPEVAMMHLQMYAYFLVFSYYCEQRLWNFATKRSFTDWLSDNPHMKLLITGVRDKLEDQLRSEHIVAPAAQFGADVEEARLIKQRHGNVLSSGRILCSVSMDRSSTYRPLRQLAPDVPIFSSGRLRPEDRRSLIENVRHSFPGRKIHWLSLRAEPMVLINGRSYTLSDFNLPSSVADNGITMHVSMQAMEQIEDRLRRDVILEAQENGGIIILHHMDEHGKRTTLHEKLTSVQATKSQMESFAEEFDVHYDRVPIPFSGQLYATDLDPLLRYLSSSDYGPDHVVIINDAEGTTRSSVVLNIITLFRAAQRRSLRTIQSTNDIINLLRLDKTGVVLPNAQISSMLPVDANEVPAHNVEILLASTICQMLTSGSILRTVDCAISLGGRGRRWNILHHLDYLKKLISEPGADKTVCISNAINGLRCYLLVLLTTLYLDGQDSLESGHSFSAWVAERTEVSHIINNLEARGEAALKYVAPDNLMKADLSRRCGDVLTANFCVKADHFPGCQKKGLRPELCGAPNFRKVQFVNVYGVAIPTRTGIHNVLSLLGATNEPMRTYPGQKNDRQLYLGFAAPRLFDPNFKPEELQRPLRGSVVWVNLREEPLIYVGDRPCVFRDLAQPYVNVELTGIETEKIEHVEMQLKRDILNEASAYDGQFLVHDEGNPGELVGRWEVANEESVNTIRDIYDDLEDLGFRCHMIRLPVTDEQSPAISDFDLLVVALLPRIAKHLDRRETLSFVFNCQMGRGRTTTGMVVCCLLIGLVTPEYYDELNNLYNPLHKEGDSELCRGNYAVIVQLMRVLSQGRKGKGHVDLVLEACSKMQNLRTAIEGYALAAASPDSTEEGRARAHHAGVHYLVRYFNIIVFAVYLEEEYDRMAKRMKRTFVQWMSAHPELTSLTQACALR